jgi:hypothetical protein
MYLVGKLLVKSKLLAEDHDQWINVMLKIKSVHDYADQGNGCTDQEFLKNWPFVKK